MKNNVRQRKKNFYVSIEFIALKSAIKSAIKHFQLPRNCSFLYMWVSICMYLHARIIKLFKINKNFIFRRGLCFMTPYTIVFFMAFRSSWKNCKIVFTKRWKYNPQTLPWNSEVREYLLVIFTSKKCIIIIRSRTTQKRTRAKNETDPNHKK